MPVVKLDKEHKQKLENYLASYFLRRGRKISIQQALGMMVDHALECEKFAEKLEDLPPLEKDPSWIMLQKPKNWGIRDASEKIDEHLYGE
jgi:hypothetical protein